MHIIKFDNFMDFYDDNANDPFLKKTVIELGKKVKEFFRIDIK